MTREQVFNFSAGPAVLPEQALSRAGAEILNYKGSGTSVMEMSHRSSHFQEIFDGTKAKFKEALSVPDTHEVLFVQGGATLQFSAVPLNLMREGGSADYVVTGQFSGAAAKEAERYGRVNIAASSEDRNHTYIPGQESLRLDPRASYLYYCSNNTIFGTEWSYVPESGAPLVCDMSSNIMSKPIDVSKYSVIIAGAQKNLAPAGLTVVIVDKAIAGRELPVTPLLLSYAEMINSDSMYNTPPCYSIYMLGLVLDWVAEQGGVAGMEKLNREKAGILYGCLDECKLITPCAEREFRSMMNVTFRTGDKTLDAEFVDGAEAIGLTNLKGHRLVGGMRASIYNAMPLEGIRTLVNYIEEFEAKHHV